MFKRILVAVDGSDHAKRAAEAAIDLAKRCAAKLYIVAVADWRESEMTEDLQRYLEVERVAKEDFVVAESIKGILADAQTMALAAGLRDVAQVPRTGKPARSILEFADNSGVDLSVMDTRGRGEIEGLILGSVSQRVTAAAKCSCLLVR